MRSPCGDLRCDSRPHIYRAATDAVKARNRPRRAWLCARDGLGAQPDRLPRPVIDWIYGLGGRDYDLRQAAHVIEAIDKVARGEEMETINLLGVRLGVVRQKFIYIRRAAHPGLLR